MVRDNAAHNKYAIFLIGGLVILSLPLLVLNSQKPTSIISQVSGYSEGDVNRDGNVTLDDVAKIREYIAVDEYHKEADLHQDNAVDPDDIAAWYDLLSLKKETLR